MSNFQHPEILFGLFLLVPLCLLFFYVLRWKNKMRNRIGDEDLVKQLTRNYSPRHFSLKFYARTAAILLCIIAAANLRSPQPANEGSRRGIDLMVAVDVSNSMLAQDVKPNRLERAKQVLNKIIEKLGDNRLGLVVFAGHAYLQMPLTPDLSAAKMYISNLSPALVPLQGTKLSDALRICDASLDTKEKKYKAVLLISDGEDHDEKATEVINLMKENGIVIYTIGIGSPEGAPLYDPGSNDFKKDVSGNVVISKLNEKVLQDIATQTGGSYQLFNNADEVANNLASAINQMEKKHIGGGQHRDYTPFFQWFLFAALFLLLVEIIIPERKMKWI
ncbi:VWA domain-containing protein [Segetibacter sp. 3557_3]|uniref:VWA domain-containing protein n=1 Tax=Segetibacter sp. 3557_3 TaxID=2547429 RepID=UPI001058443F|nr:VWA domain-containing protein [Segetibacter sp. 3557_3]TDH26236.1 VWA domain-containing protein [Segetibacter sp. 3557_3]